MGEVGPARRKSQRESTRRRFLAGGIDIGVRAHEIFRDYWGVQMEILAGGFEVTDSGVFKEITDWLSVTKPKTHVLLNKGDTLLLDNWRVLHGRTAVPSSTSSRKIHRLYLSSLT